MVFSITIYEIKHWNIKKLHSVQEIKYGGVFKILNVGKLLFFYGSLNDTAEVFFFFLMDSAFW